MNFPADLPISLFDYDLPEDRIAKFPLPNRDESKLLVYRDGRIVQDVYRNIANHIPSGALMIFNDTKVVPARIVFQKPSGGRIEVFCLEPGDETIDIARAMTAKENVEWKCLIGGASKWKPRQVLKKTFAGDGFVEARFIAKEADLFRINLSWHPAHLSFSEMLEHAGAIPLPPYLKRETTEADTERYQTVFAHTAGSVAAPTAGLHFTTAVLESLERKKIDAAFVTLHVGAGTFQPVKSERMRDHHMHAEWIDVSKETISRLANSESAPVIPVGTTSLRTIESLYWMGVLAASGADDLSLSQWFPYHTETSLTRKAALEALLDWMKARKQERLVTQTRLLIAPGYTFRLTDALITNFHQPQSTLLLLVAALTGKAANGEENWRSIYEFAMENDFRFLSYGDGSLLWRSS